MNSSTTKRLLWFLAINGVLWVWTSYALAYLNRADIAESLSRTAVTEIIAVFAVYAAKSLFEKRDDFGAVGKPTAPKDIETDETEGDDFP